MIVFVLIIFNIFSYILFNDTIKYVNDQLFTILILFNSTIVAYPLLKDLTHYIKTKEIKITFFTLYSMMSFLVYVYPLKVEEVLYYYNLSDTTNSFNNALLYCSIFYVLLWSTLYYVSKKNHLSTLISIDLNIISKKFEKFKIFLNVMSLYLLFTIYFPKNDFLELIGLGQLNLFIFYIVQIWIAYLIVKGNVTYKISAFIWILFYLYYGINTTQIGNFLILAIAFIYFDIYYNRKVPYVKIAIMAIVLVFLSGNKSEIRKIAWNKDLPREVVWDMWKEKINEAISFEDQNELYNITEQTSANRLSHISLLAYTMEESPDIIPYWNGYTYSFIFSKIIPRFIWEGKPIDNIGNQFGRRYSIIGEQNFTTSINLPVVVESFVNFGWWGLFMFWLPASILLIGQKILLNAKSFSWYLFGVFLFFRMLHLESNISMVAGIFVLLAVFIYIINKFFKI